MLRCALGVIQSGREGLYLREQKRGKAELKNLSKDPEIWNGSRSGGLREISVEALGETRYTCDVVAMYTFPS